MAAALSLKCFSCSPLTRRVYRTLGNGVGGRRRSTGPMPDYYVDRIKRMLRLAREHDIIRDGDRIIELGTGWLHWEAITLRLFYDIHGVLYDVWDNRQLGGLKNYFRQLSPLLGSSLELPEAKVQRAQSLIQQILEVDSFSRLYALLGFEYVVESSGSMTRFPDNSFDLLVSAGVLEHVYREALPTLISETTRIIKPRGWAIHSIDTSDHLAHYDSSVSRKKYLGFSEQKWRLLYQNEVQYINRLQRGEWINLFASNGFETVEEEARRIDISSIRVSERYARMDKRDLECTVLRLALRNSA